MKGYQAWLLDHICRAQTRVAERRAVEREKRRSVLSKIERSDVKTAIQEREDFAEIEGKNLEAEVEKAEEEILTSNERMELKEFRQIMRILTVEEMRLDRDYWCVRNLPG